MDSHPTLYKSHPPLKIPVSVPETEYEVVEGDDDQEREEELLKFAKELSYESKPIEEQ